MNTKEIELGVAHVLFALIGPSWVKNPDYIDTPKRVARFYKEMFSRGTERFTTFPEEYDEMIVLAHHTDYTLCPHHLLPVKLDISLAYIPKGMVLGLSKLARLVGHCLKAPTKQEELTHMLADELQEKTTPDVAVLIYGEHACMQIRGVKSSGHNITSVVRGAFREKPEVKAEFLSLVKR